MLHQTSLNSSRLQVIRAAPAGPRSKPFSLLVAAVLAAASGCGAPDSPSAGLTSDQVVSQLEALEEAAGAELAVYYSHLHRPETVTLRPDLRMHAASTMKVPVLIQLYRDQEAGGASVDDSLMVTRTFRSIVDQSEYVLDDGSDSETELYARVGQPTTYRALAELMITVSSNLATNILIQELDATRVTETMRSIGADSIEVLRGVEDLPAFEAGLSNTTTARDLGLILEALAQGRFAGPEATAEMIATLKRQQFREKIPAGLPDDVVVANKTGNITRISHDAAIVDPGTPDAYVLVVLTRGIDDEDASAALIADVAGLLHDFAHRPRT